jgi:hypothetical protein
MNGWWLLDVMKTRRGPNKRGYVWVNLLIIKSYDPWMNGITYLLKVYSLFLLMLKGSSTKSQLAVLVVVGSLSFGIICQPYLLMKIWFCERVSFSKTWNRSCTLHSFCHKLGTIGIWPICQLIVMISSSPACTYSSRWSWTLVPTPTTSWNVSKDRKRLWYSINFGGDQTINIVDEGFMQMEYI